MGRVPGPRDGATTLWSTRCRQARQTAFATFRREVNSLSVTDKRHFVLFQKMNMSSTRTPKSDLPSPTPLS